MTRTLDIESEIAQRGIPASAQGIYRRALSGSRPAAVKAMCIECQGYEDGARAAIRDCPSVGCPLHAVRPYQRKAKLDSDTPADWNVEVASNHDPELLAAIKQATRQPRRAIAAPKQASEDDLKAVLNTLHTGKWSGKSEILSQSRIDPAIWTVTINRLLFTGRVERRGSKRSTEYRKATSEG